MMAILTIGHVFRPDEKVLRQARPGLNVAAVLQRMVISGPRIKHLTGHLRPLVLGPDAGVDEFADADEVAELVADIVCRDYHKLTVWHAGALAPAEHLNVRDPESFFADGIGALYAQARSVTQSDEEAMALMLGNDKIGSRRYMISKRERATRILEAQLSGASELMAHTPDDNYTAIYELYMLGAMVRYSRNFINRAFFEHGERLELRKNYSFSTLPYLSDIGPVFQSMAPRAGGRGNAASSDALLFGLLGAMRAQMKALSTVDAAARGNIILRQSGGVVTGVHGPNLLAQIVRDGLRARHNQRQVRDSDDNPHHLVPVTLGILDSTYIMNAVIERVAKAFYDTGLDVIDPMLHIDAPLYRREMMKDLLGTSAVRRSEDLSTDDLSRRGTVERFMRTEVPKLEEHGNDQLARTDIVQAVGTRLSLRLFGDHQEQAMLDFLADERVIPAGMTPDGW